MPPSPTLAGWKPKRAALLLVLLAVSPLPLRAQHTNAVSPLTGYPFAKGTLEKIDPVGRQVVLKTYLGSRKFDVPLNVYIFRGKEKITLDKLKTGEAIKLSYRTNETGQALIKRIKVDLPDSTNAVPEPLPE